ncbi:NADH-quinone oxidoreductase subunit A [candidate division LCP-89 bacterium B3_LCP]|uniref:NADH-quinone oxidoreductase subunit n=1 Tax=candidate division LCP-89 bacterium B3_LCP TaxID=2012998 RepID=A0A532V5W5_UNCL8|nr:MAG: NADH-quinone oxidoreductase subunit A [candidate division LCP-89 bacterium B3_LCP]
MMAVAIFLGPKKSSPIKDEPFECGIIPTGDANDTRFPVKFYLVAILFIIFDIEIIFLYPWAVVFKQLSIFAFISIIIFISVLMAGLLYAVKKGVLEWK